MSILTDVIPPERRGQAMGKVMGAFAAASVLGVPIGLRLALIGGWRAPFFAVAGMGLVLCLAAIAIMPRMRGHLDRQRERAEARGLGQFFRDPTVLLSLCGTVAVNMGTFLLIPNLSSWLQQNLGYPRDRLEMLYFFGGIVSFAAMRVGGAVTDRKGSLAATVFGSGLMMTITGISFLPERPWIHPVGIFIGFMVANSVRAVALNTLSTRVPLSTERARFMSSQSAAQHLAAAAGAVLSSALLVNRSDGSLGGMSRLGVLAIILAATVPLFVFLVTARLRRAAGLLKEVTWAR